MSTYTDAVARELEGLQHVNVGRTHTCAECNPRDLSEGDFDTDDEGGFSWQSCDGCGSTLGGQRYAAHALMTHINGREAWICLSVCADCLCYIANGDEPETWER